MTSEEGGGEERSRVTKTSSWNEKTKKYSSTTETTAPGKDQIDLGSKRVPGIERKNEVKRQKTPGENWLGGGWG